jgi:hypothetical protein
MATINWATIIVDEGGLTDACGMGDEVDAAASIERYCELVAEQASKIAGRELSCATRTTLYDAIEYETQVDDRRYTQGVQYINDIVDDMGEPQFGYEDFPELVAIAAAAQSALASVFEDAEWYVEPTTV